MNLRRRLERLERGDRPEGDACLRCGGLKFRVLPASEVDRRLEELEANPGAGQARMCSCASAPVPAGAISQQINLILGPREALS